MTLLKRLGSELPTCLTLPTLTMHDSAHDSVPHVWNARWQDDILQLGLNGYGICF